MNSQKMKMQIRGMARSFTELRVGETAEFEVLIDESMHNAFAKISGDHSDIHCDEAFSSRTKFGKRIGYAFLLTSFLSKLYGEYLPGGSSVCVSQDAKFIKPYYIGDRLRIVGRVTRLVESVKFAEIATEIYRNGKERIFSGTGLVQVLFDDKLTRPLYEAGGERLYYTDFVKALKEAGVKNGDTVFVHSDISVFGRLAALDRDFLLHALTDSIRESVGERGTIIMPTFSYSFCNNELFDPAKTRSTVGVLTEHFRNEKGARRTAHPIFSVAISGKRAGEYLDIGKDSFDEDSIFGKLRLTKGRIVFFGAPFQSCTYIHHIEQMHGVPYRYMKTFKGRIKTGGAERGDECTYLVRSLDGDVILDTARLERHLIKKGVMKKTRLGGGTIMSVGAVDLFNEGCRLLDRDIRYFLKRA